MIEQALEKLEREYEAGKYDKRGEIMKGPVRDALKEVCRQDVEFAQAVVQGGSFADCMKAVAADCGSAISDLEAYRRAVRFYFKGADVRFSMNIDLAPNADDQTGEGFTPIALDLSDFL
jgi:hypothetical protein